MKVIDEDRFVSLCEAGEIIHSGCCFLDGLKIGLHADERVLKAPDTVDALNPYSSAWKPMTIAGATLNPGEFFLALTRERIAISNRIFGQLHTRSRWARLGLDCLGSSTYLSPGFGAGEATPLVLEIVPRIKISMCEQEALAALILFELDRPVRTPTSDHKVRFPLHQGF